MTNTSEIDGISENLTEALRMWSGITERLRSEHRAQSAGFNPFQLLPPSETGHSKLLGELLKPYGTHGQGDIFLKSFLEMIGIESTKERWAVTVEEGRVDILLKRLDGKAVVIIENKSNGAGDQKNQIYRYWYQEIHSRFPPPDYTDPSVGRRYKIVYLTNNKMGLPSSHSLCAPENFGSVATLHPTVPLETIRLSFETDITEWLGCLRKELKDNIRINVFLQFYIDLWK